MKRLLSFFVIAMAMVCSLQAAQIGEATARQIADKFFTDEELNQLSVITPNVSLAIIRDYEVVEKKEVKMPDELIGIIKCNNHKCI